MQSRYASTAIVAQALGVSVTTVKRWVDEGVLPAHKTAGGHRKVLLQDVLRLIQQRRLPCVDLSRLIGASPEPTPPDAVAERLYEALEGGDGAAVRSILVTAHSGGMPLEDLGDLVISPVMARVGRCWETGVFDVYQEHRATQLVVAAVHEIRRRVLENDGLPGKPRAVGGCPEGDHYLLAPLLVEMVLRENGWEAINIGPNTPLPSLTRAMEELKPRLVWLSVSYLANRDSFLPQFYELARAAEGAGVAVVVGGRALTEEVRREMPYTSHGDRLTQLAALARALDPGPRPRARPAPPTSGERGGGL